LITPSQLSLFSINAQEALLGKYGVLIHTKKYTKLNVIVYQLNHVYFYIYKNTKNNQIIRIEPSNKLLMFFS
jgi:hypothetical protein